jgi:hypothetical protein
MDDRTRTYVDAADLAAQEEIEAILGAHSLAPTRFTIGPDMTDAPEGDAVSSIQLSQVLARLQEWGSRD